MSDSASFVPTDFDPPTGFMAGDLHLEPLGPEHNERDYAAWTSSMDHIRRSPGFPSQTSSTRGTIASSPTGRR